jgi:hypothetical protein
MKIFWLSGALLLLALVVSLSNCANPQGETTAYEPSAALSPTPANYSGQIPFGFRGGRKGH